MKLNENEMNFSVPLEIIKASEIEPKEVKWLWYPYIPFGKVTLLQGDPGDGKSKLMLSIAALLSKGEPLPFTETEENEPMTIIYQTTEDDADDTVVPRFNSAGGDGENLIFIKEDEKTLSFGDNRIREAIEKYNAKLLILDPLSSYIGENCSMNNANETRAEFNHLIAVAGRCSDRTMSGISGYGKRKLSLFYFCGADAGKRKIYGRGDGRVYEKKCTGYRRSGLSCL